MKANRPPPPKKTMKNQATTTTKGNAKKMEEKARRRKLTALRLKTTATALASSARPAATRSANPLRSTTSVTSCSCVTYATYQSPNKNIAASFLSEPRRAAPDFHLHNPAVLFEFRFPFALTSSYSHYKPFFWYCIRNIFILRPNRNKTVWMTQPM